MIPSVVLVWNETFSILVGQVGRVVSILMSSSSNPGMKTELAGAWRAMGMERSGRICCELSRSIEVSTVTRWSLRVGSFDRLNSDGRSCSRETRDVFIGIVYSW